MRILIEEYKYKANDVRDILHGVDALETIEGYVSLNYVGYFYNPTLCDIWLDVDEKIYRLFNEKRPDKLYRQVR